MKLGSSLGPEEDLKEQITRVPEEMDFIEFPLGEKEQMPEDIDREGVIEALEDNDFGLVVHLPFRQRLVTEIDEFNDAVLDYHRRLIRFSKQLGAEKFVIHADMRDNESEEEEELISEQIRRMNKIGEELDVEICFENIGHWNGLELFKLGEVLEELDASMCFDTGHAFSEVGQEEMEEFLEEYSHLISHLHLQDTREGRDMHLPIGLEEIDFEPIGEKLSDFEGTATMEIFTSDRDYIRLSKKKVEEYWN
jgi:sugar phosphate isomerase/epimerase